ncbi:MAG: serine protease [bacterium]|nr:serine protease [bacterium]
MSFSDRFYLNIARATALALAGIALILTSPIAAQGEGRKIFTRNQKTVLILRTHFEEQSTGSGSAFVVAYKDRKFLITDYYGISSGYFFLEAGQKKIHKLEVLRVNDMGGIAILTFPSIDSYAAVPLEKYEPLRGEKVYAMGFPGVPGTSELSLTITDGLVSNDRVLLPEAGPSSRRFIQVSAALDVGNHGGPIFGEAGRLIGMATGGVVNEQSVNLVVPAADLMREIDQIDEKQTMNAEQAEAAVRERIDLIAEAVREKRVLDYGYFYSPEYKLNIYSDLRGMHDRVYSAHRLMRSRKPPTTDAALDIVREYLDPDEFLYYLILMSYYRTHPSDNFDTVLFEVSLNPFLASQLYLSGRFMFLIHEISSQNRKFTNEKFEYVSHTVDRIEFDSRLRNADVELTVQAKSYRFPVKLKFTREWGNWFLTPVYNYSKLLRED